MGFVQSRGKEDEKKALQVGNGPYQPSTSYWDGQVDGEEKTFTPRPVNYKRAVNSPMWEIICFLSLKLGKTPNDIIDQAVKQLYVKEHRNG